jgi:PAS domain S-box-containing protein
MVVIMTDKPTYEELEHMVDGLRIKADRADELYKSLFENSSSIKLIIDPENGHIMDANLSASAFYGYGRDRLKNMKIMDINTLSPDQVFEEMQNANSEKRIYFQFRHRLSNGEIKDVEVFSGPIIFSGKEALYSIIHDVSERKALEDDREKLIVRLEKALDEIKTLKGILPICSSCKNIRDDKGYWQQIESYISDHSDAEFSHGLCPDCIKRLYPEFVVPGRNKSPAPD